MIYDSDMPPIRPDHYSFVFDRKALERLRHQLGFTQAALAEELFLPINTVSRWETGAATPDAKALAAIYSVARDRGVTPEFFQRRPGPSDMTQRITRLIVAWDFQNRPLDASDVSEEWADMDAYLRICLPGAVVSQMRWAYTSTNQMNASAPLRQQGFQVRTSWFDADAQLVAEVMAACRTSPDHMAVLLVADDGNYAELVRNLRNMGVEVFVWGTNQCSQRLRKALEDDRFIHEDAPFIISECMQVVRELDGQPISRADFGNLCKTRLGHHDVLPQQAGFSRRNPYGSVLRWLEQQEAVELTEDRRNPGTITIESSQRGQRNLLGAAFGHL